MADDITKTTQELQQQLKKAEELRKAIEGLSAAGIDSFDALQESIANLGAGQEDAKTGFEEIATSIKDAWGAQFNFATELEKTIELNKRLAKMEDIRLAKMVEFRDTQDQIRKISERLGAKAAADEAAEKELKLAKEKYDLLQQGNVISEDALKAAEEALKKAEEKAALQEKASDLTDTQKDRLNDQKAILEDQVDELKIIMGLTDDQLGKLGETIKKQKQIVENNSIREAQNDRIKDKAGQIETLIENQLAANFGLKDTTEDWLDILLDADDSVESIRARALGAQQALAKAFNPKVLLKSFKNMMKDLVNTQAQTAKDSIIGADSLLERYFEIGMRLTQTTGATSKFGKAATDLTDKLRDQGFVMSEVENVMGGLYMQSKAFTRFAPDMQKELGALGAHLTTIGVTTDIFGTSINKLNKVFGESPIQIKKTVSMISNFGRVLGMGPNKALQEFNKQMPLLARYGKEKGIEIFKALASTAHTAGIEFQDLINITKKFDTFEGAADAASKLNFVLEGPLLNSMEFIRAEEHERLEMLKGAMARSGKAFDQMNRWQKDLIAQSLGTSVDVAQAFFNDDNIQSLKEARAEIENSTNALGSIEAQSKKNRLEAQKKAASDEKLIDTLKDYGPLITGINEALTTLNGFLRKWGAELLIVSGIIKIAGIITMWKWSRTARGLTGQLMRASGAVNTLGNEANRSTTGMGNATRGLSKMKMGAMAAAAAVGYVISGLAEVAAAKAEADGTEEGKAKAKTYRTVGKAGKVAAAAATGALMLSYFGPHAMAAGGVLGAGKELFFGAADGVTNYKPPAGLSRGAVMTGEMGPEMLSMGRGTNVITNENVVKMYEGVQRTESIISQILQPAGAMQMTQPIVAVTKTMNNTVKTIAEPAMKQAARTAITAAKETTKPLVELKENQTITLIVKMNDDNILEEMVKVAANVVNQTWEFVAS